MSGRTPGKVGHTHAPRGKRVFVKLHDGDTFEAKYKETESGYIYFFNHEKIKHNLVRKLSIMRADQ